MDEITLSNEIDAIVDSVINGQFDQAMRFLAKQKRKYLPFIVTTAYCNIREIDRTSASMFMRRIRNEAEK